MTENGEVVDVDLPDAHALDDDDEEFAEEERLAKRTPEERVAIWQQHAAETADIQVTAASSSAAPPQAHAQAPVQAPAQAQHHGDERLAKRQRGEPTLQNVMDAIGDLNISLTRQMQSMEHRQERLESEFRSQSNAVARLETEFKSHCQVVESRFESMERRLKALEEARPASNAPAAQTTHQNIDDLVAILGGWEQDTKRAKMEADFRRHLQQHLQPLEHFAPRKRGTIMVLKYESEEKRRADINWVREHRDAIPTLQIWAARSRPKQDRMRRTHVSRLVREIQSHITPAEKASEHLEAEYDLGIVYFDDVRLCERKGHNMHFFEENWQSKFQDRATSMLAAARTVADEQS
eukprot:266080-Amphidinium_carterae.2